VKHLTRNNAAYCLLCLFSLVVLTAARGQETTLRAEVMILGSYHMHNPGADVFNMKVDDVLQPTRQVEIRKVVDQIKAFQPSMIALEIKRLTARDTTERANFQAFREGKFELTRWEGHQIGFRLAQELGHQIIYHIDEPGSFPFQQMLDYAESHDQTEWIYAKMAEKQASTEESNRGQSSETIGQQLFDMNTPGNIEEGHQIYVGMCQIGKDGDFPGTDVLTEWFKRNARIFSNLYKITDGRKNERIVVIFGAGHSFLLRELVRIAPEFRLVEPNDYLKS